MYSHHKFDSSHPEICFLGDVLTQAVTSDGGKFCWDAIGLEIDIPRGTVPEGEVMELRVWPCLAGPFDMPKGYQATSPPYLISPAFEFESPYQINPAFEFESEVKLSIAHYAHLESSKDYDRMSFVTSSSSPKYSTLPRYKFKVMEGGIFNEREGYGVISLKHFCLIGTAQKTSAFQRIRLKASA